MIIATSPAILTHAFPPAQRGRVLGIQWTAVSLGLASGPPLGGWPADALGWRSTFYVNSLAAVLAEEGVQAQIRRVPVSTEEHAVARRFPGSPTIRIDGQDLQPETVEQGPPALTYRLYVLDDGRPSPLPSREMIRRAVRAAAAGGAQARPPTPRSEE